MKRLVVAVRCLSSPTLQIVCDVYDEFQMLSKLNRNSVKRDSQFSFFHSRKPLRTSNVYIKEIFFSRCHFRKRSCKSVKRASQVYATSVYIEVALSLLLIIQRDHDHQFITRQAWTYELHLLYRSRYSYTVTALSLGRFVKMSFTSHSFFLPYDILR